MSDGSACNWCREFKNGHKNVLNKGGQRHKLIMTEEVHQVGRENSLFTISDLLTRFTGISHSNLYRIVFKNLGYHKLIING